MSTQKAMPIGLVLAMLAGDSVPAQSHSWYPQECCSNGDCTQADGIATDARGVRVIKVGHRQIGVPRDFPVRPSPDERIHICFRVISTPEDGVFVMPYCVFLPAPS
jgi:hypothetical protein